MTPFAYERAESAADAVGRLGKDGAFLAGGTNLVDHMRLGIRTPSQVVDISRLPLTSVTETPNGAIRIGALVRNSDMAGHPLIRRRLPFVAQALLAGASGQIRNLATTGGNLLQRTRCVYFQNPTTPCNKRQPGSGCSARQGFGRYNAVFGASEACVATHPSDLCVPLAALDTTVIVQGPGGERRIPFQDLHRLPGDTPDRDTSLEHGDLVTAIEIEDLPFAATSRYRKVRDRASYAFALVSVAAAMEIRNGQVMNVRIGLGGVSHRPHRAARAEAHLIGGPASREAFVAAADAEIADATPGPENAFKLPMLRNTIAAVLADLTNGSNS